MSETSDRATGPVGLTRDAGWEIGVRRTLPFPAGAIWDLLLSDAGRSTWLGGDTELPTVPRTRFRTTNGTVGELRSYAPGRLLRLTWQPADWPSPSTLQVRVLPTATGTTLSIHHERLDNEERRSEMREHWSATIDRLATMLTDSPPPT